MKRVQSYSRTAAFNLIELLAVLAIVGLIAATFLQPKKAIPRDPDIRGGRGGGGGYPNQCMMNQKAVTEAFINAARDRDDQAFWIPAAGEKEPLGDDKLAFQYRALSNYLQSLTVLICPSDRTRWQATGFDTLDATNVSYFLNVDARKGTNAANTILIGDRHLEVGTNAVAAGLFIYTNGMEMGWTTELHSRWRGMPPGATGQSYERPRGAGPPMGPVGSLAFADGHAERYFMNVTNLSLVFARQGTDSLRLLVP